MEINFLPLAEVDLKVDDVVIKFDEDPESYDEKTSETHDYYESRNSLETIKQKVNDYDDFNFHFLTATNTKSPARRFQCEFCGKYFNRKDHLKNHRRTHTGERPYECDLCPWSFAKHYDLTRHKKYVHSSVAKFFVCEVCGKIFPRKYHLKSHMKTHKDNTDKIKKDQMQNGFKVYTCSICKRSYCRVDNLKKHMQKHFQNANLEAEAGEDIKNSEVVIKEFNFHFMSSNELGDKDVNSIRSFACDYCGRLFLRKDHLKNHERTHTGERPFQCDLCDKKFAKRFVLTRHLRNVHKINKKLHECTECDRKFARTDHLKTHMKIHILGAVKNQKKDKIPKCEVCNKEFSRSDHLKTHMKIHLLAAVRLQHQQQLEQEALSKSPKNYDCQVCTKNCSSPNNLKKHEENHCKS